jgi:hypothetical protein
MTSSALGDTPSTPSRRAMRFLAARASSFAATSRVASSVPG